MIKATDADPAPTEGPLATRDRILGTAEALFGERGVDGVSLREITSCAGVNVAAAHYYFGSKDALLDELFQLRAQPIVERRLELLGKVRRNRKGQPVLEDVLRAFLRPSLDAPTGQGGDAFVRLRARMAFESADFRRAVLGKAFDASSRLFLEAVEAALPQVPAARTQWRFHFLLGAMVYTMASPGRIEAITDGTLDTSHHEAALEELVSFASAGLRAQ